MERCIQTVYLTQPVSFIILDAGCLIPVIFRVKAAILGRYSTLIAQHSCEQQASSFCNRLSKAQHVQWYTPTGTDLPLKMLQLFSARYFCA